MYIYDQIRKCPTTNVVKGTRRQDAKTPDALTWAKYDALKY